LTIGIGAIGPDAGLAVFRTLELAERIGAGAIGGYAVFAAIGADGTLHRAETQRGGTRTLFTLGERTGVEPPKEIAEARFAAVMSSGPDRPAPLSQFLPGDGQIGLVTGHRLPNALGPDGRAYNAAVLDAMSQGLSAQAALEAVLSRSPDSDAGMIALGPQTGIAMLNSARVARRPDLGSALLTGPGGAAIAILHNAIWPAVSLAPLLAETGLEQMAKVRKPLGVIEVLAGTPVIAAAQDRVVVDDNRIALRVETSDARIVSGRHNCAAIYIGARIIQNGALLGRTTEEPNIVVEDGRIVSLSGQTRFLLSFGPEQKKTGDAHDPSEHDRVP